MKISTRLEGGINAINFNLQIHFELGQMVQNQVINIFRNK